MSKARQVLAVPIGILILGSAVITWAGEAPSAPDLERTVEALKMRLRDQERRIAELEDQQSQQARREDIRKLVDEVVGEVGPSDFRLYWDHGMRAKTGDGRLAMKFGGRLMYDFTWADGDDVEDELWDTLGVPFNVQDGSEVRRARLYWQGEWNKKIKFKWQMDFAGGDADVKDLYLELKQLPVVGNLRMGHFKEPFSLNELTSSKYITFVERATPNVFAPGRNAGFMLHNHALNKRMTWAAGVFREVDDWAFSQQDGDYAFTTRATALPYYANEGERLIHVGVDYSYRSAENNPRYRQRPEAHILNRWVNTGNVGMVDHANRYGAELAGVFGPFHFQGEYLASQNEMSGDVQNLSDPCFQGWYAQVGYFLTGETRPYKTSGGHFDRVRPRKNWDEGGPGAWEIALRYSNLDLQDEGIAGGEMENYTVGLNWYLNQNVRIMWNYIHSEVNDLLGIGNVGLNEDADIFVMRLQVDF